MALPCVYQARQATMMGGNLLPNPVDSPQYSPASSVVGDDEIDVTNEEDKRRWTESDLLYN